MNEGIDFHEDDEEASPENTRLEERETKVKEKARSLTPEERDEIIRRYNAEHSIPPIPTDAVDRLEESGTSLTDSEGSTDEERQLEGRVTKVKDCKEHPLTAEERDEIIRRYNDEQPIHQTTSGEIDRTAQSKKSVTDSEDSVGAHEDVNPSSGKKNIEPEKDRDRLLSDELLSNTNYEELVKDRDPRLYSDEILTTKEIAKKIGCKPNPFPDESYRDGLESYRINESDSKSFEKEVNLEDVRRLYLEEGLSLKKIGEQFGYKTGKPIKRILEAAGIEIRPVGFQKIEIDPKEVYRMYFNEQMDLKEVAAHFGCESTDPIHRIFDEQGWKTRYQETYETEIDPEEVFRLYNEEGLSLRDIGKHYGVSIGPIRRIFEEYDIEYGQEIRIDPEVIHHLYFEEGLSKEEVCERLGVSKKPVDRIIEEQGWEKRPAGFQPVDIDIDEFKRLYYEEELPLEEIAKHLEVSESTLIRYRKEQNLEIRDLTTTRELRDKIFGKVCVTCGKPRRDIHKKDGEQHLSEILWRKKDLLALNPDDWAALCRPCHRLTHSLMKNFGCEWNEIETTLKELARKRLS